MIRRARQRQVRLILGRALSRDNGTTLMELVVGMTIMSIFGGMFTTVVVMMNKSESKAEAVNATSAQIDQAFLALDKTVRYAAAISTPAAVTATGPTLGDWYVELRTTNTGSEVCTQFRVDTGTQQLQKRSWSVTSSGVSNLNPPESSPGTPTFTQVASRIVSPTIAPLASFVLTTGTVFQQLTINLESPPGPTKTISRSSFTFSAVNSIVPAPAAICQEAGRP